jgi:type IV secretion system protein VirB8
MHAVLKKLRLVTNPTEKDQSIKSASKANKPGKSQTDQYFTDAGTWDQEIFASISLSRNRAWLVAFFCMGVTVLALLTLILLLPLKTFAPYVITVDKSTGYVEVTKGLYDGNMTIDQAVTESNLVRYVSTRESYNPSVLRENYNLVALMSAETALDEYQRLWDGKNQDNPSVRMGTQAAITIKIKSVSFLNERTASVRFLREYHANDQIKSSDWIAVVDFQYVKTPMKMEDRFQNPLGFQVTSYRINPEAPEIERTAAEPSGSSTAQRPVSEQKSQLPQQ